MLNSCGWRILQHKNTVRYSEQGDRNNAVEELLHSAILRRNTQPLSIIFVPLPFLSAHVHIHDAYQRVT
jgi:hypothetical protein